MIRPIKSTLKTINATPASVTVGVQGPPANWPDHPEESAWYAGIRSWPYTYQDTTEVIDSVDRPKAKGENDCRHIRRNRLMLPNGFSFIRHSGVSWGFPPGPDNNDGWVLIHGCTNPYGALQSPTDSYIDGRIPWNTSMFGSIDTPTTGVSGVSASLPSLDVFEASISTKVEDMHGRAFHTLLPGIRQDMSIINSLLELKDLKSLLRSARRLENTLILLRKQGSWRRFAKLVADIWLQKSFNIDPLIRDILSLLGSATALKKQIDHLLSNEGKEVVRHFSTELPSGFTDSETYYATTDNYVDGSISTLRVVRFSPIRYVMTVKYSYTLPNFQRLHLDRLAFLDHIGANLNPAIVWNAIPWSFVIDWTAGVSSWLSQFKEANITPQTVIHSASWSAKYDSTLTVRRTAGINAYVAPLTDWLHVELRDVYYIRKNIMNPAMLTKAIQTSGLNLKELSLAFSLGTMFLGDTRKRR